MTAQTLLYSYTLVLFCVLCTTMGCLISLGAITSLLLSGNYSLEISNSCIIHTNRNYVNKPKITFCTNLKALSSLLWMDLRRHKGWILLRKEVSLMVASKYLQNFLLTISCYPDWRISLMRIKAASHNCLFLSSSPFLYWLGKKKANMQLDFGSTPPQRYWFNYGEGIQSACLFFHIKHLY